MRNHFSVPSWLQFPHHFPKKQSATASLFLLSVWFSFPSMISVVSAGNETTIPGSSEQANLLNLEIEGISLSTPAEKITDILTARGYIQSGEGTTYIKEAPLAGGRKTLYRIEIEETGAQRSVFYFRGESGGRVKSPSIKNRPVPGNETVWARTLYKVICGDVPDKIQQLRACRPLQDWDIGFGQGTLLKISDQLGAQLDASGPSTTASIVRFKQ